MLRARKLGGSVSGGGMSGGRSAMVVGSLAPWFALFSPARASEAVLVTVAGASRAASTVSAICGYDWPAASESLRLQLSDPRLQSQPDPEIDVAVRPAGRGSVTVTAP